MNIFQYDYYTNLADSKTYKEVTIKAARGEIRDRYGRLIAGNTNSFVVEVSSDQLTASGNDANGIALKIMNKLIENNEDYEDNFPIIIDKNGNYSYTYDQNVSEYKEKNNIPANLNAKETFYYLVDSLIDDGTLKKSDRDLKPAELQKKLNSKGYYPPILVSNFTFTEIKDKNDWLESFVKKTSSGEKIEVKKTDSAKVAFEKIRKYYEIDESLSDQDARKILVVRNLIKSQGYKTYYPVTLASNVSEETISFVEENAANMSGISISSEPIRYYPNGSLASHVLGYVGKIPSQKLDEYLNNKEKEYQSDDIIGLTGIEATQEDNLKGIDGYKKVKVNATGKITDELEVKEPVSGDTVYLTLDMDLQKVAEEGLEKTIKVANNGGTFKSDYGDVSVSGGAVNAKTGAVIAVDIKTGEVLASASYPDYDPNLFVTGISSKDYDKLQPKNPNDTLAASPLLNLVTQGVFQPGSTFKMVTGMAALENGLDPNYTIADTGVIKLEGQTFGDAVWNKGGGNHGAVNLYKAIQESCNIYFGIVGTGTNFLNESHSPGIKMNSKKILEYAKLFGLNENTGLEDEITEVAGKVPSEEDKINSTKISLRSYLNLNILDSFTDIDENDDEEMDKRIDEIVSWVDEYPCPGRGEVMNRLADLKVKEDRIEDLADSILFTYLKFARWTTSDNLNLSIGQGENAYTPSQIVRYVMAIANGGYLTDLTLTKKVVNNDYETTFESKIVSEKIDFKDDDNLKDLIKGMKLVTTEGTAAKYFANFPVAVVAKSGTAERNDKIPTSNEYNYLMKHLSSYGVNKDEVLKVYNQLRKDREAELTKNRIKEINEELKKDDLDDETRAELEKELKDGVDEKLANTDKINAAYLRRAIKKVKPSITDEKIDAYKETYGDFGWAVAFAPADDPEIAVAAVIPQGTTSTYAFLPIKDIIGYYVSGSPEDESDSTNNNSKDQNSNSDDNSEDTGSDNKLNFQVQIKK
ncbi:penicillin-binding transpeptidase domain-containing protein [Intestinibacter sp.]|uniref:penicillin-binding transpeptidase domain-containing protein n=1 Tax=Intestinibacter sp. TaxID=1965304 RepID=UPI002A754181|nr:penicillin-binding transpeptidase domain-containing protein [Intestinibacter sp.]MDY2737555.1 penicillin-binding transpeptidase domain-containing protein [Intestinibacter sp.]